jgi:hypothetical protein
MSRRWKGPVIKVSNPRFEPGSPEHEKYKEKQRNYYYATADEQRNRARERAHQKRRINQQYVVNYLVSKSCEHCGVSDTRVLSFDHRHDENKFANIADLVSRGAPLNRLIEEIKKCDVLCHNCHMIKTFEHIGGTYHTRVKPCSEEEFQKMIEGL